MRILLTHHFPLAESGEGWLVGHWAAGLVAQGSEVHLLIVDEEYRFGEPFLIDRVVCGNDPNADLKFALPRFSCDSSAFEGASFQALSSQELAQYRERLRRRLDALILRFNPHVIHSQHVWLLGQLALETGVPYLLNAWGPELTDAQSDERYGVLAEQAAENAGRILAADEATRGRVASLFDSAADRVVVMPPELDLRQSEATDTARATAGSRLQELYRAVLDERFG